MGPRTTDPRRRVQTILLHAIAARRTYTIIKQLLRRHSPRELVRRGLPLRAVAFRSNRLVDAKLTEAEAELVLVLGLAMADRLERECVPLRAEDFMVRVA